LLEDAMKAGNACPCLLALAFFAVSPGSLRGQSAANPAPAPPAAKAAPPTASAESGKIVLPAGTRVALVLENAISTRTARPGDPVYLQTIFPVVVSGRIVMPAATYVSGEVLSVRRPGRVKGRAELRLKLTKMILPNGYAVNLEASPTGSGTGGEETVDKEGVIKGSSDVARDAGIILRSTVYGAGIGAAAGGLTGARAGLGAGSSAGLLYVLLTRGPEAELPRGSTLEVVLDRPLLLDASRASFTSPGQSPEIAGPPNRHNPPNPVPF
jgi:hypothetical protein